MSALRRIVSQNVFHMKNVAKGGMRTPAVRNMSTLLEGREKTDEARYIRRAEEERAAELRRNLERIMALEDSHAEKAQLVEILGKLFLIDIATVKLFCTAISIWTMF